MKRKTLVDIEKKLARQLIASFALCIFSAFWCGIAFDQHLFDKVAIWCFIMLFNLFGLWLSFGARKSIINSIQLREDIDALSAKKDAHTEIEFPYRSPPID